MWHKPARSSNLGSIRVFQGSLSTSGTARYPARLRGATSPTTRFYATYFRTPVADISLARVREMQTSIRKPSTSSHLLLEPSPVLQLPSPLICTLVLLCYVLFLESHRAGSSTLRCLYELVISVRASSVVLALADVLQGNAIHRRKMNSGCNGRRVSIMDSSLSERDHRVPR